MNKFKQNCHYTKILFKSLFKVIKKLELGKLFGKLKKDEKILENFLNKKRKKESKEKEIIKKESIICYDKCIQTDNFEEIKNIANNNILSNKNNNARKCDWNISKMKCFLSQNNSQKKLKIKSILLWLNDEINIKEDISEIFYLIKWEEVDDEHQ